jgi:anti-sigma B factor antagonist
VVEVTSETLDADSSHGFKRAVTRQIGAGKNLVLDLAAVQFVDSSGLGAILSLLREFTQTGGRLKLAALAPNVRAVFELVRMHRILEIYNRREEAIRSFAN